MNIFLLDDDNNSNRFIERLIFKWAREHKRSDSIMIRGFTSSEDLLEVWRNGITADAVLLDIQIPNEMSGLALAKEIHISNPLLSIVFVTNYGEYAEEGYKVNAFRYLRKPVTQEDIWECMDILWNRWYYSQTDYFSVNSTLGMLRLPVQTLLYIEIQGHYCLIRTINEDNPAIKIRKPLSEVLRMLPDRMFVQCHRSFVVNLMYARRVASDSIVMADGKNIPVGRDYKVQIVKRYHALFSLGGNES